MTLKQEVHELVEALPEDSPFLADMRDTLKLNQALAEGLADAEAGRTYTAEELLEKVRQRWPNKPTM